MVNVMGNAGIWHEILDNLRPPYVTVYSRLSRRACHLQSGDNRGESDDFPEGHDWRASEMERKY